MQKLRETAVVEWIIYSAVIALVLIAAVNHWYLLDGINGAFWSLCFKEDTEYAAGYRDDRFREVRTGMDVMELRRLLGNPLEIHQIDETTESWLYSRSPTNSSYRIRTVLLEVGRVRTIYHEFYVD